MRCDYYKFSCFSPYKFGGETYKTLSEAKAAYLAHIKKGHHVGCDILGCTQKDDSVFLTFTPWYSDTQSFGRTNTTYIGHSIKIGAYQLN